MAKAVSGMKKRRKMAYLKSNAMSGGKSCIERKSAGGVIEMKAAKKIWRASEENRSDQRWRRASKTRRVIEYGGRRRISAAAQKRRKR